MACDTKSRSSECVYRNASGLSTVSDFGAKFNSEVLVKCATGKDMRQENVLAALNMIHSEHKT